MAKITLRNLSHSYDQQNYALQSLDHEWQQGGAYALLGPSGCGKSTLLNIISGLLAPSEGEVLFDDQSVNQQSPQQRNIAQVFQFPVVYDAMTVSQNLAFPLLNQRLPKAKIQQKVAEVAELLELTQYLDHKAKSLSADLKQKISMGRGLVREDVAAILFDEPLTVIDPHLKWKLRRKLKEIHQRLNITMVYVTHDQLEAATFADEIAVMYQGKIVQFGQPQDLFEHPQHSFVGYFIGSPGMNFVSLQPGPQGWCADGQPLPLTESQRQVLNQTQSNNVKVGIRPEYVCLHAQPGADTLPCEVVDIEHLGHHQLATLQVLGQTWFAKLDEHQQFPHSHGFIELPAPHLKLFIDEYLAGANAPLAVQK